MSDVQKSFIKARRLTLLLTSGQVAGQENLAIGDPATGKVKAGASLSTGLLLGTFHAKADATAGDVPCDVDFGQEITILFAKNDGGITSADIFKPCYVKDALTVSKTATARALAGTILVVDAIDGVGFCIGRAFLDNT